MIPEEGYFGGWGPMLFISGAGMLILAFILFVFRAWWLPAITAILPELYSQIRERFSQGYSFLRDREAGFSSSTFDLTGNIESGDNRQGLDPRAKRDIAQLMRNQNISFDEARAIYTQQRFRDNDIGPDGRPTDPRAVFFS